MTGIEAELREAGIPMRPIAYQEADIETLERVMGFDEFYSKGKNPFYKRKMCEYLLNYKLLGLDQYSRDDIYVDVGSSTTPAVMVLREQYGLHAYGVDLCESPYRGPERNRFCSGQLASARV